MLAAIAVFLLALHIYLVIKRPVVALLLSIPAATSVVVLAGRLDDVLSIALGLCIPIGVISALLLTLKRKEPPFERNRPTLKASAFVVFAVIVLLVLPSLTGVGLVISCLLIGFVLRYLATSRDAITLHIISVIGSSIRQNLPLAPALSAAAVGGKDRWSRPLQRISDWLTRGHSLSEAILWGYPACPGNVLAMINAAERIDQLPLAIKAIEADLIERSHQSRKINPVHPLYPLLVLAFAFSVVFGLTIVVVPKLKAICDDHQIALPPATMFLVDTFGMAHPWVLGLFAFVILVVVPAAIYTRFRPRRPDRPRLLSRVGDFIKWHLPVLHWFEKHYSLVQVVELLRLGLNAGAGVDDAIGGTINLDVNGCFKNRLRRWHDSVLQGRDIADAARRCGLGSALAWAFDQGANQGNTPAVLEMLETFYRCHYSYMANIARYILWPVGIIVMACVVGFVVYAFFSPIIAMTEGVIQTITP